MGNFEYVEMNCTDQIIQPSRDGFIEMCDACCYSLAVLLYIERTTNVCQP